LEVTAGGADPSIVEPPVDVFGVEADQVSPLDERDASLVCESPHVPDGDAQALSDLGDVDETP
jgi:hypothetical protein